MAPSLAELLDGSVLYAGLSRFREWAAHSTTAELLTEERALALALGAILAVSLVRVLTSTMDAPVKFLSFALLFAAVAALTWRYADPRPQS